MGWSLRWSYGVEFEVELWGEVRGWSYGGWSYGVELGGGSKFGVMG